MVRQRVWGILLACLRAHNTLVQKLKKKKMRRDCHENKE